MALSGGKEALKQLVKQFERNEIHNADGTFYLADNGSADAALARGDENHEIAVCEIDERGRGTFVMLSQYRAAVIEADEEDEELARAFALEEALNHHSVVQAQMDADEAFARAFSFE